MHAFTRERETSLGYWWNCGHKKWGRDAEEFIEQLGYKRKTLQEYGSICNLVKPSMRMEGLSFNHHQIIAALEPSEQSKWLKEAKDTSRLWL